MNEFDAMGQYLDEIGLLKTLLIALAVNLTGCAVLFGIIGLVVWLT